MIHLGKLNIFISIRFQLYYILHNLFPEHILKSKLIIGHGWLAIVFCFFIWKTASNNLPMLNKMYNFSILY